MTYRQNKEWMECKSIHPYNDERFNFENAKTFIVGSIPPYRFSEPKNLLCGDVDWYYGSKDNSFWDILKDSCCDSQITLCTKENQRNFFKENKIGIFDMIQKCTRKNGGSSSDNDLYNLELIDVCEMISGNKNTELKLFFTSIFVADLFSKKTGIKIDSKNRKLQEIAICDKKLKVTILYSPSPSWSRGLQEFRNYSKEQKDKLRIEQYKQICV